MIKIFGVLRLHRNGKFLPRLFNVSLYLLDPALTVLLILFELINLALQIIRLGVLTDEIRTNPDLQFRKLTSFSLLCHCESIFWKLSFVLFFILSRSFSRRLRFSSSLL